MSGRSRQITSEDGLRRMWVESSGELFRFGEETFIREDGYSFWSPTHESGLYETADEAERAAHAELLWLRHKP